MNRLIIMGNGFDLAHKMKTSYLDFILSYLKDCFLYAEKNCNFSDMFIEVCMNHASATTDIENIENINDLIVFKKKKQSIDPYCREPLYIEGDFSLYSKNYFFDHLLTKCCEYKWVDIENEYYDELKRILSSTKHGEDKKISELNESMGLLISLMNNYLEKQKPGHIIPQFFQIFEDKIKKDDVVTLTLEKDELPDNILFLNFNYTDTIEKYLLNRVKKSEVNYIHGKINDESNPIIFGFGDEIDDTYVKIESEKKKGFLDYIKSFWYFKTSNYHNLIRFINSDDFQVYILGHSCGLSDRTMLKMIFEHAKCKSIKIFYHASKASNNYTELTQEISRHFKDKGEMRKKIVPLDKSDPMPQIK